jgi:hypothetical protein
MICRKNFNKLGYDEDLWTTKILFHTTPMIDRWGKTAARWDVALIVCSYKRQSLQLLQQSLYFPFHHYYLYLPMLIA